MSNDGYTATCGTCGFTTNRYGTQAQADAALAAHVAHRHR